MVSKITLAACFLLLISVLSTEAQRDSRRRSGRRKTTTESSPEESDIEKSPQKVDAEPEIDLKPSSTQQPELETNSHSSDKEAPDTNQGGPPFIVPRGTRKPRPQMRRNGEAKPKPTLPAFTRKRGPRPDQRDLKKIAADTPETSTTTAKPFRNSSRNRSSNTKEVINKNSELEKVVPAAETGEAASEASTKKRFGGGITRRPSRGNRRYNPDQDSS